MKILIDAGHRNNLNDFGACGNSLKESELALNICKLLKEGLEKIGQKCYMTRNSENDIISVSDRPKKAKQLGVDLLISVHINSATPTAEGIEVLYKSQYFLADKVCKHMVSETKAKNRGAKKRTDLGVLNGFDKSILVECGFISNVKESKLMNTKEYQKKLVKGIVKGVAEEFGISIQSTQQEETKQVVQQVQAEDKDLVKAISKIVKSGVQISENSWNNTDRIKVEHVGGLLNKLGGIDKLVEDGIINSTDIWKSKLYTANHVRNLLIKYASKLG